MNTKFTTPLLLAGLIIASGAAYGAESTPPGDAPKPPARPTTLPPASTKQGVTFATDVKPLFEASCTRCHGAQRPKGGLRLDTLEGVLKGSEDGKVLEVGNSAKSDIVTAIARINPKTAMPPERKPRPGGPGGPGGAEKAGEGAKSGDAPAHPEGAGGPGGPGGQGNRTPAKPLTAEEVGLVRAWIDQGAK